MSCKSYFRSNINRLLFFIVCFTILTSISVFARSNTVCTGKEFNKRVKTLVDGGDVGADYKVLRFERGDTPPSDSDFYVDISEDNDESVIAYITTTDPNDKSMGRVNLYWYATDTIFMNENTALMFQGFANIRYIDLTGFSYFEGLNDTRYMFKDCRHLRTLHLQPTAYNPANGKMFTPTEIQGMYYGCESLQSIDMTMFNTYLVSNMAELFCKCFNLRSIYVNNTNWNIESVTNFKRMFTDCHLLRSTTGKKAVDISDDDYEKYARVGINGVDSFIRDTGTQYIDYVSSDEYVPIEEQGYLMQLPEAMEEYYDEPEEDNSGSDNYQNNAGNANDETGVVVDAPFSNQTQAVSSVNSSQTQSYLQNNTVETNLANDSNTTETIEASVEAEVTDSNNTNITETSAEGSGTRIIELDEYLKSEGNKNKEDKNIIEVLWEDYQPLVITLLIAIFVLLILIGMVLYLYKEKKISKDSNDTKL